MCQEFFLLLFLAPSPTPLIYLFSVSKKKIFKEKGDFVDIFYSFRMDFPGLNDSL